MLASQTPLSMVCSRKMLELGCYLFLRGSFWLRELNLVSCLAGRFFTKLTESLILIIWGKGQITCVSTVLKALRALCSSPIAQQQRQSGDIEWHIRRRSESYWLSGFSQQGQQGCVISRVPGPQPPHYLGRIGIHVTYSDVRGGSPALGLVLWHRVFRLNPGASRVATDYRKSCSPSSIIGTKFSVSKDTVGSFTSSIKAWFRQQ